MDALKGISLFPYVFSGQFFSVVKIKWMMY